MAKRKQLFHPDEVKQKIQASQLINRLQDHVFSEEPTMDGTQVTAALKLLGKVVPDLKAVEHSGPGEGGEFLHKIERVIVKATDPDS